MLSRKPIFRLHYLRFIDETSKQIAMASNENFQEVQQLRFALASVLRSLAPDFVESKSERFDAKTRKKLFDQLYVWCDEGTGLWAQESVSDYKRDIERYKSVQRNRSRESISIDREIMSEQMEVIQWTSMNAMTSLLYGPCFDDNARKLSGRVITWINGLFLEHAPRAPFGSSPADPRTPSYFKYTGESGRGTCGRDKKKGGQLRVLLAKTALKNLLQTNLELFPAFIDQVSSFTLCHFNHYHIS